MNEFTQELLKNTDAVIFDLDGTLLDSMYLWEAIDIEFLARRGIRVPFSLKSDIAGLTFHEVALYFKTRFQLKDSIEEIMEEWNHMAFYKYAHEVQPKDKVVDFIHFLKGKGIKTGIATSNSRKLLETALNAHGLLQAFDYTCTSDETEKGKPEPDIYLHVAEKLGLSPAKCLVFEDIPLGILAGKRAGMRVCAVDDSFSRTETEEKKKLADYFIESFAEIG